MTNNIKSVVIIGAGNMAHALSNALVSSRILLKQVISRSINSAQNLAKQYSISFTNDFREIDKSADLYIIAASDSSIKQIIQKVELQDKIVVHTSGSISVDIFKGYIKNYGVIYPLQTISRNRDINFSDIPLLIEANNQQTKEMLVRFSNKISDHVNIISSKQRLMIHLSAIFASNFSNHMLHISKNILEKNNLSFDLLKPLMKETIHKALEIGPEQSQTGPAKRGDMEIIDKHMDILNEEEDFKKIYAVISNSIINTYKKKI